MKQYICPCGERIVGSFDVVQATALISGWDDDGNIEYQGYTDVDWDSQVTKQLNGKDVYVCDNGEQHTLDECKLVDEGDEPEAPAYIDQDR